QPGEPLDRGEAPDLLPPGRHRVVVQRERPGRVQMAGDGLDGGGDVAGTGLGVGTHPTAPSICSSISRFSSSAYSIGSSLAIGSMKPRTIMAIASSSVRPRLIR